MQPVYSGHPSVQTNCRGSLNTLTLSVAKHWRSGSICSRQLGFAGHRPGTDLNMGSHGWEGGAGHLDGVLQSWDFASFDEFCPHIDGASSPCWGKHPSR